MRPPGNSNLVAGVICLVVGVLGIPVGFMLRPDWGWCAVVLAVLGIAFLIAAVRQDNRYTREVVAQRRAAQP